jgi:hypothetical protein
VKLALSVSLVCVLVLIFLSGCSVAETILDVTAGPVVTPSEQNLVVVSDTATPVIEDSTAAPEYAAENTEEPEETEQTNLSTTTGRPLPEGSVYRPVVAVIDNAAQSRPQTGLMLADVVYEFLLDRSSYTTRYLAVFSDSIPERIGPIRDSRDYLATAALEWDGLYISAGDPENAGTDYTLIRDSGLGKCVENTTRCSLKRLTMWIRFTPRAVRPVPSASRSKTAFPMKRQSLLPASASRFPVRIWTGSYLPTTLIQIC